MNSKLLHFLCILACATLLLLGPLRAQNQASGGDANGNAVSAPASTPNGNDAHRTDKAAAPVGSDQNATSDARSAVENDRGTVAANQSATHTFHAGWIGLLGLFGLLGLIPRRHREQAPRRETDPARAEYPRAA